jgi:predicted dinucleotide-binding enzyme
VTDTKQKIAILGTGRRARTLAKCWVLAGRQVIFGTRTPDDKRIKRMVINIGAGVCVTTPGEAVAQAEVVVFALSRNSAKELLPSLGDLTGKIVIDPPDSLELAARSASRHCTCRREFPRTRVAATIENRSDPRVSDKVVVAQQEYRHRATQDDHEVDDPRQMVRAQ